MFWNGIFVLLLLFLQNNAFNLDTSNPVVYVDLQNKNSTYFGYTVILYPGSENITKKWIKIGAPKGFDPYFKLDSGVVYNCPLLEGCKAVNVHEQSVEPSKPLENAWIGGSMDISYGFDRMSICAFRARNTLVSDYQTVGCCYFADVDGEFEKVTPLVGNIIYNNQVYYYGQAQVGFSAHFPAEENSIILGAPGVYNWAGTVVKVTDIFYEDPTASRFKLSRGKRGIQRPVNVADPFNTAASLAFDLFGYAVTSGYFYGERTVYYAASTPKAQNYRGKVVIFQFNGDKALRIKESKIGSQFGEYFGASLAAGDINSDGYDDLIVGAPFHVLQTYNEGSVYIFLGGRTGQLTAHSTLHGQQINGQFGTAIMFLGDINRDGYGDIAVGAPYEEESSGVLYIYKGNSQGLDNQHCQRIVGKEISSEIRGFGISISRPADVDENGYKDIAVGAHLSAHAVLLRTKPVIVIKYDMEPFPKQLKHGSNSFEVQVCYGYTDFAERSVDINRTITVDEVMGRATLSQQVKIIKVSRGLKNCENITISIKKSLNYEAPITVSLSYKLAATPQKKEVMYISDRIMRGRDMFCVGCPILDEFRSSRPSTIQVPFTLDCGDDNICQTKLSIEAEIPDLNGEKIFVVGSQDYVNLKVTVRNTGEKAYSTQVEISLPAVINFRQIPSACNEKNISVIICNVENPLRENREKTIYLDLDMKDLNKNNVLRELNILLKVLTTSINSNKDSISLKMKLAREADVTIYGKSEEQSLPFGNTSYGMPNFTQVYQVEKIGVSPLEKVEVTISVPYAIVKDGKQVNFTQLFPPEGIFSGQPIVCRSSFTYIIVSKSAELSEKLQSDDTFSRRKRQVEVFKNSIEKKENLKIGKQEYEIVSNRTYFINCSREEIVCSSVVCTFGPFGKRQTPAAIEIKMMFDSSVITGMLGGKDVILYTTFGTVVIKDPPGFMQSGNRPDSVEVSSLFVSEVTKKKRVALWIIILSIIVGILLLALIVYGLTKAGFFKRAKKEELKSLKAAAEQENEDNMVASNEDQKHYTPIFENLNHDILDSEPVMNSSNEGLVEECEEKE